MPGPTGTKPRDRGVPRENIVPLSQSGFECQRTVSRPGLKTTAGTRGPAREYLSSSSSWVRRPSFDGLEPDIINQADSESAENTKTRTLSRGVKCVQNSFQPAKNIKPAFFFGRLRQVSSDAIRMPITDLYQN